MTQPTIERKQSLKPELRFTPYAWAKLLFMCHTRDTEVSGMGIGAEHDPMLVEDILIVKQRSSAALTTFDPEDYANKMVDLCDPEGKFRYAPTRCQRIWIHTHPAGVSRPSGTDHETFETAFGLADWAVMFIYSKSEDVYCQLRMTCRGANGLSTELRQEIPTDIVWGRAFPAADPAAWKAELDAAISHDVMETVVYQPPMSAIGVMPVVRAGIVQPPRPQATRPQPQVTYPSAWSEADDRTGVGQRRRGQQPIGKSRLVPIAGSLLAGLSSQQLTRLLMSDISKESLHSGNNGSIIAKMRKNGWEIVESMPPENPYVADILPQVSSVHFMNKAFPDKVFGNRDLALADHMAMTANQTDACKQALEVAEFDLQAVAEDRALGEFGQKDSYGFDLEAVYPWHVPGRVVLFVSLNELEELLLTLEGDDHEVVTTTTGQGPLVDQQSIKAYIASACLKLKAMGVSTHTARSEILVGLKKLNPSLCNPRFQDILEDWVDAAIDTLFGLVGVEQEDTQQIDFNPEQLESQSSNESANMLGAKGSFRDVLVKAKNEGLPIADIDQQLSLLYDKALTNRWQEEFRLVLDHVRVHGYDPACLDKPIEKLPELSEG